MKAYALSLSSSFRMIMTTCERKCFKMKIEVWSYVVCPFCLIGKRHLEEAIEQSGFDGQIDVVYKGYELDPTAPATTDEPYHVSLARKYQISDEQAEEMVDNILQRARGA